MGLGAYTTVFARSIVLAAIATAICLVLAFPVSYLLSRMRPASQRMMQMLIMLPMWMNFLLRTYAWMSLLEHNGIINRFLGLLGVGPFNMINTSGAVVLGMVYNYLPYMVLPLYTIMVKIDNSVIEAAQDLGANVYHVVAKVLVPLSMPRSLVMPLLILVRALDGAALFPQHLDGVADIIGVFFDDARQAPVVQELVVVLLAFVFLHNKDDLGAHVLFVARLDGIALSARGLPLPGLLCAERAAAHRHAAGHHERRVEAHAELADHIHLAAAGSRW